MKIALLPLSCKPIHAGHWKLIELASNNSDAAMLFVSIADRNRKNEYPISGKTMQKLWIDVIENQLPENVIVSYTEQSPVKQIYQHLDANRHTDFSFSIYSDPNDLKANFPIEKLQEYFSDYYSRNALECVPVSRNNTVNISGTEMRKFLQERNQKLFLENLPNIKNKEEIWRRLI